MQAIQEVFLEADYEELEDALAARAERSAQLQAQGMICKSLNLYTGSGHYVFLLQADPPASLDAAEHSERRERRTAKQSRDRKPQKRESQSQDDASATPIERKKPIKLPKFESR